MAAEAAFLRVIPGGRSPSEVVRTEPKVVAEILEDGTIRTREGEANVEGAAWTTQAISGADWVIWLQRRTFR